MAVISLRRARTMIRKAFEHARGAEMNPLAAVVLDAGGNMIAFEREDGASPGRFDIARAKAYGAVMLDMPGSAQMARAEAQSYFVACANGALGGGLVPVPGGVLVKDSKGVTIGAVGVSGDASDNDAAAARAGIEATGLAAAV